MSGKEGKTNSITSSCCRDGEGTEYKILVSRSLYTYLPKKIIALQPFKILYTILHEINNKLFGKIKINDSCLEIRIFIIENSFAMDMLL